MADRTCVECGAPLTGRKTRFCSRQCRVAALLNSEAFKAAQVARNHRRKTDPEYRAAEYARKVRVTRECEWCGAEFVCRRDKPTRVCSPECSGWLKRKVTWSDWSPKWPAVVIRHAGLDHMVKAVSDTKGIDPLPLVAGWCHHCGASYVAPRSARGTPPRYCTPRCTRQANAARRRARQSGAHVATVKRADVFKRDRYTCRLCGKRLAMKQQVPHPKAPTIDHIIPLADGGTHEMANVQAAHFICNSAKRDRATGNQLQLVG